jgi:hypothetical protein
VKGNALNYYSLSMKYAYRLTLDYAWDGYFGGIPNEDSQNPNIALLYAQRRKMQHTRLVI